MSLDKYLKKPDAPLVGGLPPRKVSAPLTFGGRIFMFFFGLIFFAAGCGIVWHMGVKTLIIRQNAQSWPIVTATVEHSRVATIHGDESTTYKPEILYRYTYQGRSYKSSRYGIHSVSSSDYGAAQRVADSLVEGSQITAYVNPTDPYYALVVREGRASDYFGFVFILFILVGGGIMSLAFAPEKSSAVWQKQG